MPTERRRAGAVPRSRPNEDGMRALRELFLRYIQFAGMSTVTVTV